MAGAKRLHKNMRKERGRGSDDSDGGTSEEESIDHALINAASASDSDEKIVARKNETAKEHKEYLAEISGGQHKGKENKRSKRANTGQN